MADAAAAGDPWRHAWEEALATLELDVLTAERLLEEARRTAASDPLPPLGSRAQRLPSPAPVPASEHAAPVLPPVPAPAWEPPHDLGPLPVGVEERARVLLARQLEVSRRMAEAVTHGRRQAALAQALRVRPSSAPVFVDTDG